MGAGTQLIDAVKASGIGALELWRFQANERARHFCEARGFHATKPSANLKVREKSRCNHDLPTLRDCHVQGP
jgi:hypothetical protein